MPDLAAHSLSRRFGSVQALKDLSLTVREGEIYGFVGSNGAGKTTAMRIILGVLSADAGHVTYGGAPYIVPLVTEWHVLYYRKDDKSESGSYKGFMSQLGNKEQK